MKKNYSDKLKDPRWQRKRLEILERDNWHCQNCFDGESTLHVHHRRYFYGKDPWDYENHLLLTLCENCHEDEKVQRGDLESDLLEVLKEKFLCDQLRSVITGFMHLKMFHMQDVVASVIEWTLSNDDIMRQLKDLYSESLIKKVLKNAEK